MHWLLLPSSKFVSNLTLFCRICPPISFATGVFSAAVGRTGGRIAQSLRAGRSGDRIPVGARFFAPVQTGPGAHPASYTMDTGSFP